MNAVKGAVVLALGGLSAYFGQVAVPLAVLAGVMLADYLTGVAASWLSHSLSSRVGLTGILCKLLRLLVAAVGFTVDWLLHLGLSEFDASLGSKPYLFGTLVTLWLIVNELISILENLAKSGISFPPFLKKLLCRLKSEISNTADEKTEAAPAVCFKEDPCDKAGKPEASGKRDPDGEGRPQDGEGRP